MSYPLEPEEDIASGVRRSALHQIKLAEREIDAAAGDETVHEVRKRFKRIRALARLVRDPLGEKAYRATNIAVRDAAKPLAAVRDAHVLTNTLQALARTKPSSLDAKVFEQALRGLEAELDAARARTIGSSDAIDEIQSFVRRALKRIKHWEISPAGASAIRGGLERTYDHARRCYLAAAIDPSIANLHEWRKQTKYLRNQLAFIEPLCPRSIKPFAEQVHALADCLGEDHDLAVLLQAAADRAADWGAASFVEELLPIVRSRRIQLQEQAIQSGGRIHDRTAADFAEHLDLLSGRGRSRVG